MSGFGFAGGCPQASSGNVVVNKNPTVKVTSHNRLLEDEDMMFLLK
jgi:hypothetical protein